MYKMLIRPLMFRRDAEAAHEATFALARRLLGLPGAEAVARGRYALRDPRLRTEAFGLDFPNPVGLAAGLDKNAELLHHWATFGFGFIEVGTVTPKPQPGNPKPRLFRLLPDNALLNRMGFNNEGADAIARRLELRPAHLVVGANIGKNKDTPNDEAAGDYVRCLARLHPMADYFVVNVSSPNTPGLRDLQARPALQRILAELQNRNAAFRVQRPILLKIAPDLTDAQLEDVVALAHETRLAGVVATNTTIARAGLRTPEAEVQGMGQGGLSGPPLRARSTQVVRKLAQAGITVVGVGGIDGPESALEKFRAGARLVQLYTGLVYEGPGIVRRILKAKLKDAA